MKILAIESSCDETAASLCEARGDKFEVLSNVVSSQIKIHKKYGGVVPEVAARKHTEVIYDVIKKAMRDANAANYMRIPRKNTNAMGKVDMIAVTEGPGLVTSLRVGVLAAQAIAGLANIPLVGVNHIEAHLLSPFLSPSSSAKAGDLMDSPNKSGNDSRGRRIKFPALGLIVSGGHTELVLIKDFGKYKLIGSTRDDAVGEAFDKVAKMLGLGYPGGPAISKMAGDSRLRGNDSGVVLPRPMMKNKNFDFSFSGLKTAVLYEVRKMDKKTLKKMTPAICREFQDAVIDVLVYKTRRAAEHYNVKSILVGGGVSANKALRDALEKLDYPVYLPEMEYTGDNAAMIAFAGWKKWLALIQQSRRSGQQSKEEKSLKIKANPNLMI